MKTVLLLNNSKDGWIWCCSEEGSASKWVPATDCFSLVLLCCFFFSFPFSLHPSSYFSVSKMDSCWDLIYSWGLTRSRSSEACTWLNWVKHVSETQTSVPSSWSTSLTSVWCSIRIPKPGLHHGNGRVVIHPLSWKIEYRSTWPHGTFYVAVQRMAVTISWGGTWPTKGLIPLMAVVQEHKQKVWLVLDYQQLNGFVEAFTANADVCSQRLREWRRQGANMSLMDLRKAYLQIRINKTLWPFQTVIIKGK